MTATAPPTSLISGLSDTLISNGGLPTLGSMFRWDPATGKWEDSTTVVLSKLSGGNLILQASTHATKGYVGIVDAPRATANFGLLSLGSGAFDGSSAGFFVGSANGTLLAGNAVSGYTGNLLDFQVAGSRAFNVSYTGATIHNSLLATAIVLLVKGAASQSSNLQEWQDSSANILSRVNQSGQFFAPYIQSTVTSASLAAFVAKGAASQTGNALTVQNSSSTTIAYLNPFVQTTGSPTLFSITGPAHTTLTASTEAVDINFNLARTVQWATGALTLQRAFRIQTPTYAFVGASTLTEAVTVDIDGPPVAGTNATITGASALRIKAAPFASSKMGLVSLGSGPWDGATAGFFAGSASGTLLAGNAASGFTGKLIEFQVAGATKFSVDAATGANIRGQLQVDGLSGVQHGTLLLTNNSGSLMLTIVGSTLPMIYSANAIPLLFGINSVEKFRLNTSGNLAFVDATNMVAGTTTGTKIGIATTEKWSIWNATPIVQPTTAIAAATFVANTSLIANDSATFDGYTIGQVVKALRNFGLLA